MKAQEALNLLHEKNEKDLLKNLSELNSQLINKSNQSHYNKEKLLETEEFLKSDMGIKQYKLKHAYQMYLIEQQEELSIEISEIKSKIDKTKEEILNAPLPEVRGFLLL